MAFPKNIFRILCISSVALGGLTMGQSQAAPKKAPAPAVQRVTITLPAGYKNQAAIVKAGRPIALTFKLTSDAGCGNTVMVPAAHWTKKLKVGQSATVVYTPQKSGALKFACSMDMYRGTILVK